jgi:hypothetical protein
VFCFFRLAAILQGVKKRALIGTASSTEAEVRGAHGGTAGGIRRAADRQLTRNPVHKPA